MMQATILPVLPDHEWDMTVDVLVIGAGGCGLAAAIAAHDGGANVAILEKRERPGGNSSLSTGSVPGAGSRFQREAGIQDDPQTMVADLERLSGPSELPALTRRMAGISAQLCEWLVDVVGARMSLITDYMHVGHTVPRLHAPVSRRGQDLVDDLLGAVAERDIPLVTNNPVSALYQQEGRVVGVMVSGAGVETTRIGAHSVILASNGFGANRDLVRTYCPEIAGAEYFGALGSEGEAIDWGRELGAGLANMRAYQGYAAVAYPHGSLLSWTTIEKGGILVNALGQRFGNEDVGYSAFAKIVLEQGMPVYAIFDDRIKAIAQKEEEFLDLVNLGGIRGASDARELAAAFGLPADALQDTLQHYAQAAGGKTQDAFGRQRFQLAPLDGRLWICRVSPGLFHTQGGLVVNDDAQVLRSDGEVIAGLYAGGGAAAGISGSQGAGGYASGNGLLSAIGLGYLAGMHAAARIREA